MLSQFQFNSLWLAVFYYASPFFQMEIPFFIYASLIMPTFSGKQLGHKTQAACIMVILLSTFLNPASLISTCMFEVCNASTSVNNSACLEKSNLCTVLKYIRTSSKISLLVFKTQRLKNNEWRLNALAIHINKIFV